MRVSGDVPTGNALIQVDAQGQNSIVLFAGTNHTHTPETIDAALSHFERGDILLCINEINLVDVVIDKAYAKGLTIALNPSPFNEKLDACDLGKGRHLSAHEVEGEQLTGERREEDILRELGKRFPTHVSF